MRARPLAKQKGVSSVAAHLQEVLAGYVDRVSAVLHRLALCLVQVLDFEC